MDIEKLIDEYAEKQKILFSKPINYWSCTSSFEFDKKFELAKKEWQANHDARDSR